MVQRYSMRFGLVFIVGMAVGCSGSENVPAETDSGTTQGTLCVAIHEEDKLVPWTSTTLPAYVCNGDKSTVHPDGPNACRNTSDCTIIASGMVREITRVCGLGCRSYEPDCAMIAACNSQCVVDTTRMKIMEPGLSAACGECYTNIALCSLAYCLSACAASADAPECVKCQFESGCRIPFERCSGLDRM